MLKMLLKVGLNVGYKFQALIFTSQRQAANKKYKLHIPAYQSEIKVKQKSNKRKKLEKLCCVTRCLKFVIFIHNCFSRIHSSSVDNKATVDNIVVCSALL